MIFHSILLVFAGMFAVADNLTEKLALPPVHAPTINLEKLPPQLPKKKYTGPIYLDARPAFEYALGHVPQAVSIRWQDYAQIQEPHKGALDPDVGLLSRKLRYSGIDPTKEVIIIGSGAHGTGEDGRIGWMLNYLGVKKVRLADIKDIPGRKSAEDTAGYDSVSPWIPRLIPTLRIRENELTKIVQEKTPNTTVIDVRDKDAFARHIPGAVNISWSAFAVSKDKVKDVLKENNVDPGAHLIFYSQDGVSSGFATFMAFQAGLNATHYDGSFNEWEADPRAPIETLQSSK